MRRLLVLIPPLLLTLLRCGAVSDTDGGSSISGGAAGSTVSGGAAGGAAGGSSGGAAGGLTSGGDAGGTSGGGAGGGSAGGGSAGGGVTGGGTAGGATSGGSAGGTTVVDAGFPNVDRRMPQLFEVRFTARTADDAGTINLGQQLGHLDTRVPPRGELVVYLHGAGAPTTCGSSEHGRFLAGLGFHVFAPCYESDYGVGNCGSSIGECRLEAFDGVDRHPALTVSRPDSIEERIIKGLQHLARANPQGDWTWYLDNGQPRWNRIVISGISHGASTSGVIGKVKPVARAVMLSGPLDTNQAWLAMNSVSPASVFWAFTHTQDSQHAGHLAAFQAMGVPGMPTRIEDAGVPYGGSHRLFTSVPVPNNDGHGSTQAGGSSPRSGATYIFAPVWQQLYTGRP